MKDIKVLISTILIICSFFIGYLFAKEKFKIQEKKVLDYVNIEIKKTKINISKSNPNIIILVNGKENQNSLIDF